jgi:hypothetical protein
MTLGPIAASAHRQIEALVASVPEGKKFTTFGYWVKVNNEQPVWQIGLAYRAKEGWEFGVNFSRDLEAGRVISVGGRVSL